MNERNEIANRADSLSGCLLYRDAEVLFYFHHELNAIKSHSSNKKRIAIYPNSSVADRRDRLCVGRSRFDFVYLTANTGPLATRDRAEYAAFSVATVRTILAYLFRSPSDKGHLKQYAHSGP